jgi:predicted N-acetyltransferase YhbS
MIIRPETPHDFAAIATVHARAFGGRANEAVIVALLRHHASYDPDLSLVAEVDGQVVGHAMFSAYNIRLLGHTIRAVNLAPLAVDPSHQRQGIGGALMEEGHTVARRMGFALSFLLGHASYYPRFGYQPHAYGASSVTVMVSEEAPSELGVRPPTETDLPALHALWEREEAEVDFAIEPGPDLLDWISPIPSHHASVYVHHEEVIGYTRGPKDSPRRPQMFLARAASASRMIVGYLSHSSEIVLPLHPSSAASAVYPGAECIPWKAAMVCPLTESPFDEYIAQVIARERPAGRPIWPVAFDAD